MLLSTAYPPFEGEIDNGPLLRLALSVGPPTRLVHHVGGTRLEGLWRPRTLTISPPRSRGVARTGEISMIGLALEPRQADGEVALNLDHVTALAGSFQDDAVLVSVLTSLHYEAKAHGASSAFFDQGRALILRRLTELHGANPKSRKICPLCNTRFARVLDYVEHRLTDDLSVAEMAAVAGLDSSGFTRSLRARTGLPPYAWLTERRMERAKALLMGGIPVTQIAFMLGYTNPGKFSAAFRRVTGHPPSQWKRLS